MRVRSLAVALILLAPLAAAQDNASGNQTGTGPHVFPSIPGAPAGNNETAPSPSTGNNGSNNSASESVEGSPGVVYGLLVLVGMIAFLGIVGYLSARYWRQRPRP